MKALDFYHTNLNHRRGRKTQKYGDNLAMFVSTTARFFRTVFEGPNRKPRNCKYHEAVAQALGRDDSLISFNYDCLIDEALKTTENNVWNPRIGYCLEEELDGSAKEWAPKKKGVGRRPKDSIKLLKLHGSLNWQIKDDRIDLRKNPYGVKPVRDRRELIPPVWSKEDYVAKRDAKSEDVGGQILRLWQHAAKALASSKILVCVGYSLPDSDHWSEALLRESLTSKTSGKLDHVIIVDPDPAVGQKITHLIQEGISSETRIHSLKSIEELAKLLKKSHRK
jgi:hypothetical protein